MADTLYNRLEELEHTAADALKLAAEHTGIIIELGMRLDAMLKENEELGRRIEQIQNRFDEIEREMSDLESD